MAVFFPFLLTNQFQYNMATINGCIMPEGDAKEWDFK